MTDIGVLIQGLENPIVFEAEKWKFNDKFLRLLEGNKVIAQFPTATVLGVWFDETIEEDASHHPASAVNPQAGEAQHQSEEDGEPEEQ
ncbi:MAG: hypothetical protein SGI92_29295 [Bryobacteraceae bacterium]|nr:hypothetical protein [Bryobacteraceae bacterium]